MPKFQGVNHVARVTASTSVTNSTKTSGIGVKDSTNSLYVNTGLTGGATPIFGPDTVEVVTATNIITASENGKTFFLNSATEFVSTLPAPAAGLKFTFIVSAAPSGASYTVVTNASGNVIKGHVLSSDLNAASDGDIETSGADTISFVDSKAVAGDRIDVISDGTTWFATGKCSVFDAITFTTAS